LIQRKTDAVRKGKRGLTDRTRMIKEKGLATKQRKEKQKE
jgi:hypothetical protein